MRKINVGVVGTGIAAENHYKILKQNPLFKIKSICGKNKTRLNFRKKNWRLNAYTNVKTMIEKEKLEVVLICNQNNLHFLEAKKAVNSGVHILIEKPIDAKFKNSIKLVKLCERKKRILAVVMQKRYDLATNYLKKLVKKNYFGKIISVKVDVFMHRNNKYFSNRKWIRNKTNIGGGITLHHAIHSIDQIIYILNNKISNVSFWQTNHIRKLPFEDTSGGWIKFTNNLVATINSTVCAYPKLKNRIEIIGDKNAICLEKDKIMKLPVNRNGTLKVIKKFDLKDLGNYKDVWENFGYAIRRNKQIPNFGKLVLNTERVISDMYESSRKNKVIYYK